MIFDVVIALSIFAFVIRPIATFCAGLFLFVIEILGGE
jgi:hypothetical protein